MKREQRVQVSSAGPLGKMESCFDIYMSTPFSGVTSILLVVLSTPFLEPSTRQPFSIGVALELKNKLYLKGKFEATANKTLGAE